MSAYALGLDFGTESVRAILVEVATGATLATAVMPYPDGVIDRYLPGTQTTLPTDWALQNPADWLSTLETTIKQVMAESHAAPQDVVGIGIDFTACTVLPARADGAAFASLPGLREQPHAWAKLWKHHAAQPQADRINALARRRGEKWLPRYGGKISSEWLMPKALQLLEEAPEIYAQADRIVEGADWVVSQLTGQLTHNACGAGYKGTWHKSEGYPSTDFLAALEPGLANLYTEKLAGPVLAPGVRVGGLTAVWAERLGLAEGTPVASPIIDAHAAAIGGGVVGPGVLFMIMGTSTCHMLMAEREVQVEGISGVVEDGIVPGLFGYEAGQVGVGDIFAWFVESATLPDIHAEAARRNVLLHTVLSDKAAALRPGQSGLLALGRWNGCRTPLVDADLGGIVLGYSLTTPPEAVYRALIEATAFGTRLIVELFTSAGVNVTSMRAGGGLTKNEMLLGIYADVLGLPLEVSGTEQASALGAAILGAVAGAAYASVGEAAQAMAPPPSRTVSPHSEYHAVYDTLYLEYCALVDVFGRDANSTLKHLRALQRENS